MLKKIFITVSILLVTSSLSFSQSAFELFESNSSSWKIGKASETNVVSLTDNFSDVRAGDASVEVNVEISDIPAGWGTWTDISLEFPEKQNFGDATDLIFSIKVLRAPTHNRSLQFTFDIFDKPEGASGAEHWRWQEDLDIWYNSPNLGEWHDVVIPISRMSTPGWAASINKKVDLDAITKIGFGIHSDSTYADSITVLFDNFRLSKASTVAGMLNFDDASGWAVELHSPENKLILEDNFDDVQEGAASLQVTAILGTFPAPWGTWTDAKWKFKEKIDISGADEIRFWTKIVKGSKRGLDDSLGQKRSSNYQFTFDFFDEPAGATGAELWRYLPANGGVYGFLLSKNHSTDGWNEIAIPFTDFGQPGWYSPINAKRDLSAISTIGFGIHADTDDAKLDTVIILFDNMYATSRSDIKTGVNDEIGAVPFTFNLENNYPNPFNPTTTIKFQLPETGNVNLKVYNTNGEEVYTVVDNANKIKGSYSFEVDFSSLASGVYFYKLEQNNLSITKKMTLLK